MLNKAIVFETNKVEFELVIARHLYIRVGTYERIFEWRSGYKVFKD